MKKLTQKEEEVMSVLWQLKKAFVKEVVDKIPGEKLHYNTVSTVVRRLEEKGYVNHEVFGNTYRYRPAIKKDEYSIFYMNKAIKRFFDDSYTNLISFFIEKEKISKEELSQIVEKET